MSKKKLLVRLLSVVLCMFFVFSDVPALAAVLTFETQYDYEKAETAWLTDLVIKEDMTSVEGMSKRVQLVAAPDYPYTETAESFKKEVEYFRNLYTLTGSSAKAAYIMLFEIINSQAGIISSDINDEDIRTYLESLGIEYPEKPGADELVMARVLYTAIVTGAVSGNMFGGGSALEEALIKYLITLTGMDIETLKKWLPEGSVLSLDNYVLAAAKLTLWTAGFDVNSETPEDEVYRLVALMTIRKQGVSADSDMPFDEIKTHYIAAMLGKKYSVTIDSAKLKESMENNDTAFYILQLIGRKNGLSVTHENSTYEEAFSLVAEHTGAFDIEPGEFYADIKNYDIYLSSRRSALWFYPTAYASNLSNYLISVTADGNPIKNNYYTEVKIDAEADTQVIEVRVTVTADNKETSKFTYYITVHQGDGEIVPDTDIPGSSETDMPTADSLIASVLKSLGLDSMISEILTTSYHALPPSVTNIVPYIAPTFDAVVMPELKLPEVEIAKPDDSIFISVLDDLGSDINVDIKGVPGVGIKEDYSDLSGFDKYITFD